MKQAVPEDISDFVRAHGTTIDHLSPITFDPQRGGLVSKLEGNKATPTIKTPHIDGFVDDKHYVIQVDGSDLRGYHANGTLHSKTLSSIDDKLSKEIMRDWEHRNNLLNGIYHMALAKIQYNGEETYLEDFTYQFPLGPYQLVCKLTDMDTNNMSFGYLSSNNALTQLKAKGLVLPQQDSVIGESPLGVSRQFLGKLSKEIETLPLRQSPLELITNRSNNIRGFAIANNVRDAINNAISHYAKSYDLAEGITDINLGNGIGAQVKVTNAQKPPELEVQNIVYDDKKWDVKNISAQPSDLLKVYQRIAPQILPEESLNTDLIDYDPSKLAHL